MKQITKNISRNFITRTINSYKEETQEKVISTKEKKNKKAQIAQTNNNNEIIKEEMTPEQITSLEEVAQTFTGEAPVKRVKKDRGLIERTESSKIILTEDNRQVLVD